MLLLRHLVAGHRDIAVCRMVPTPKVKGMASSPCPPQGRVQPSDGLTRRRVDRRALAPSLPLGSGPMGLGLRLCKLPGSR